MKKVTGILLFIISLFCVKGQQLSFYSTLNKDSLNGFNEEECIRAAISEGYFGEELKVRLKQKQKAFIREKYKIPVFISTQGSASPSLQKNTLVPACTNEDFEASASASITSSNQIAGWTITRGDVQPPNDACNLAGCCAVSPVESMLITSFVGYIDPIIGAVYPIFSVFGSNVGNPNSALNNPQLPFHPFGNNFLRLNSSGLGAQAYSVEKLSKSFVVTPSSAIFYMAYIFVSGPAHACCSSASFRYRLFNATTNSLISCSDFTLAGPNVNCPNFSVSPVQWYQTQTGIPVNTVGTAYLFNKWEAQSFDLSPFMGQQIDVEIIAADCDAVGHYGYAYIDAQCGPSIVEDATNTYTNSVVNLSSCTPSINLFAPLGFENYSWTGPLGLMSTSPILSTTLAGTYTLTYYTGQLCLPTIKIINFSVPNPSVNISSSSNIICAGQTVTLQATGGNTYTWSTGATGSSIVVTPANTSTYAVIGQDSLGCVGKDTIIQYITPCVSLEDININVSTLEVFPNPATDELFLSIHSAELSAADVFVFNSKAQLVLLVKTEFKKGQAVVSLNTNPLEPGIYYIQLVNNGKIFGKKEFLIK